jgi:hypothetical protein
MNDYFARPTDHLYLVKYLNTASPFTSRYIELHAANPREAATTFERLIPSGVIVDVFPPPVPPEDWVPPSRQRNQNKQQPESAE